jgi:hypothetical protein
MQASCSLALLQTCACNSEAAAAAVQRGRLCLPCSHWRCFCTDSSGPAAVHALLLQFLLRLLLQFLHVISCILPSGLLVTNPPLVVQNAPLYVCAPLLKHEIVNN